MAASSLQMMVRIGGTIWLFQAYDHELRTDMFLCFFFFMAAFNKKILRAPRRTTQSSFANKYAPHNTSGLSEALDHSGPGVFHPLGKVRVVSLICRVHDFGHVPAFSHGKSSNFDMENLGLGTVFFLVPKTHI